MKQSSGTILLAVAVLLACPFNQAQQREQGPPDYLALSFQLYQAGHYQESIEASQKALKADPKSVWAYNNMAVNLLALKKYDEAIASAQHALSIQPDYPLAANNLVWIREEKAKAMGFVALPKSATPTPESHLEQSYQAFLGNQFQDCITEANEALRLRPGYAEAYNNLGACSASLGKWDDAIRNDREALRLKPDFPRAKNNLTLAMQGKTAQKQ